MQRTSLTRIFFLLLFIVLSFFGYRLAQIGNLRFDWTEDKRYTLSQNTIDFLSDLDAPIYVQNLLDGKELPPELKRIREEANRLLSEMRRIQPNIEFETVPPLDFDNKEKDAERMKYYSQLGIYPKTTMLQDGEALKELIYFPFAIVRYKEREIAIPLAKISPQSTKEELILHALTELEFVFIKSFRSVRHQTAPLIGLLQGHGELPFLQVKSFIESTKGLYEIKLMDMRSLATDSAEALGPQEAIKRLYNRMRLFEAIIIAKPTSAFTDLDKYLIDQYIMHGGKVLWLLDGAEADMNLLANKGNFLAYPKEDQNLQTMLFKYGARINPDLVLDISCAKIPLNTSSVPGEPQFQPFSWYYFPLILPESTHPISRGLDMLKLEFPSSISAIETPGVTHTPLLKSSVYSGIQNLPSMVYLEKAIQEPKQSQFQSGQKTVALLLEGTFTSFYKNKIKTKERIFLPFEEQSKPTRMIVVSDGDIIRNDISRGEALPLGIDKFSRQQYSNGEFLLNSLDYLLSDNSLLELRNKTIEIKMLDTVSIKENALFWKVINAGIPVVIVLLVAGINTWVRKKKYT